MDKEQMQEQELGQVSGGVHIYKGNCKKCGTVFIPYEENNTLIHKKIGCGNYKTYLICPNCGYKWEKYD